MTPAKISAMQSNALKHGKYAKLPKNKLLRCNICPLRPGCRVYDDRFPDRVCSLPEEVRSLVDAWLKTDVSLLKNQRAKLIFDHSLDAKNDKKIRGEMIRFYNEELDRIEGKKTQIELSGGLNFDIRDALAKVNEIHRKNKERRSSKPD